MTTASNPEPLTTEEEQAITDLQRLGDRWPRTLTLLCMDGGMHVIRTGDSRYSPQKGDGQEAILADIHGIPNDGGAW